MVFGSTYSSQLEEYMVDVKHFRGCHPKDWCIDNKPNDEEYIIFNSDISTGDGKHWMAGCNRPDTDYIEYFDSFGLPCPDMILEYLRKSGKRVANTTNEIQHMKSSACGYYVVNYLKQRSRGIPVYDILYEFSLENQEGNERKLEEVFDKNVKGHDRDINKKNQNKTFSKDIKEHMEGGCLVELYDENGECLSHERFNCKSAGLKKYHIRNAIDELCQDLEPEDHENEKCLYLMLNNGEKTWPLRINSMCGRGGEEDKKKDPSMLEKFRDNTQLLGDASKNVGVIANNAQTAMNVIGQVPDLLEKFITFFTDVHYRIQCKKKKNYKNPNCIRYYARKGLPDRSGDGCCSDSDNSSDSDSDHNKSKHYNKSNSNSDIYARNILSSPSSPFFPPSNHNISSLSSPYADSEDININMAIPTILILFYELYPLSYPMVKSIFDANKYDRERSVPHRGIGELLDSMRGLVRGEKKEMLEKLINSMGIFKPGVKSTLLAYIV